MNIIGLDISKDTIDCHLQRSSGSCHTLKIPNTISGCIALLSWIKSYRIRKTAIAMEATGIYYETAANFLSQYHTTYVINPYQISSYAQSQLNRTKTDPQDAALIADFTRRHLDKLIAYCSPQPNQYRLNKLIRLYGQLTEQIKQTKNRLHTTTDAFITDTYQAILALLSERKTATERELLHLIQSLPELDEQHKRLMSIPSIGAKTAIVLLSYLNAHHFSTCNKFTAFVALSPKIQQSGTSVDRKQKLSNFGHKRLKTALFKPALVAYKNNFFPQLVHNLTRSKKPKMVIITAIMRKLAKIAYYLHKTQTVYDPTRHQISD